MATVTKSIGTSSRDYSTIALWEADLDESSIYSSGDTAVGECYADSDFTGNGTTVINGGGTIGLDTRTLTAASGERNDGSANTGVRLLRTSGSEYDVIAWYGNINNSAQVEWLEIDAGQLAVKVLIYLWSEKTGVQKCLLHGGRYSGGNQKTMGIYDSQKQIWICNNIVYDMVMDNGTSSAFTIAGIWQNQNRWTVVTSNTVYGITLTGTGNMYHKAVYGIYSKDGFQYQRIYNNIAMGTTNLSGNTHPTYDFDAQGGNSWYVSDKNLSSDTTAPGSTNYRSETASDIFVSTTAGSEDLHLKSGTNAVGNGKDSGQSMVIGGTPGQGKTMPFSPYTWEVGIGGYDREAADAWDIGAAQFVASEAAQTGKSFLLFMD